MSTFFKFSWLLAAACSTSLGAVCTGEWNGAGTPDNEWSVTANWSTGCSPQADGDSASFGLTGPVAVTLDIPVTLTDLTFNSSSQNFTISGTEVMTMQSSGSVNPTINVEGGTQTLNNLSLETVSGDTLFLSVDGTLDINNSFSFGGSANLTIDGTGTIKNTSTINSNNYIQGDVAFTNQNQISATGDATINSGVLNNLGSIFSNQEVIINGGTINSAGEISSIQNLTINEGVMSNLGGISSNQEVIINGGTINSVGGISSIQNLTINEGVVNNLGSIFSNQEVIINGGVVNSTTVINPQQSLVMNGGILNNSGFISTRQSVLINGGVLNNTTVSGEVLADQNVIMNGGAFNNSASVDIIEALMMNGGTFVNEPGGTTNCSSMTINGGTVINQAGSGGMSSSGIVTINGGLLQNDAPISGTSGIVNSPGVVTGTGFFDAPFINNGMVIPGDLPGTLTFSEYTQTAAGDLVINVLDSTVYGSVFSESSASLAGTLTVAPYPGFAGQAIGVPLTIVTTETGVSGTFSNIVDLFPTLRAEVTYLPTTVVLELFSILSSFISFKEVTFSTINQINLLLVNHMDRMVDPCCCPEYGLQFYVDPLGASGKVHSKGDLAGYRFNTGGVLLGLDMFLSEGGVGLAFDYERVTAKGFHNFGDFSSKKYHFSGYATYLIDSCIQLDAIVGAGWESNRLRRSAGFFGDESARSNPNGDSFDAFLGSEYFVNVWGMNITPMVGLQYIYYRVNRFEESGVELFDYVYDKQHYDSLRSLLGFKLNRPFNVGCFQIVPQINAAWQYECLDRSKTLVATNTDLFGIADSIFIPRGGQNIVLAGVDLAVLYDRYTVDLSYEYEGSKRYYNHFFYLELAAAF